MSPRIFKQGRFMSGAVLAGVFFRSCIICICTAIFLANGAWAESPDYGGTLRVAEETDSWGYDAIKTSFLSTGGQISGNLVMERLFEIGRNGELIPVLGLSAAPSEDGKAWSVTLRRGVSFHDGEPFNADAVVAHWGRILNPENRYRGRGLFRPLTSVEKTGEYEVRFILEHPWKPFLATLGLKRGLAAFIPSPKAVANDVQNRAPVGTGPFIFKEWKSGYSIRMTKNPDYWQKGKPYLDEVEIRIIPDHETRYAALLSGQVDVISTDRPGHVNALKKDSNHQVIVNDTGGTVILMMNTSKPPFDDVRVRQALASAWDQQKYIDAVYKGIVPSARHWFGEGLNCGDAGYREPDLDKAKKLIAEHGKPVEAVYIHSRTKRGRETGLIVQQMFKKIGVTVKPAPLEWGAIMKQVFSRQYDLASWVISGIDDMGPMTWANFHSKSPFNATRYASEEVDDLLIRQRMSTDPQIREQALCSVGRKVNGDAPFLYAFQQRLYVIAQKNVKGLAPPRNEYIRVADVWLKK